MSVSNNLQKSLQTFPIQWASFIRSIVLCGCAFGLKLTGEQIAALMLVVETGLTVYTHQQVTNQEVQDEQDQIASTVVTNVVTSSVPTTSGKQADPFIAGLNKGK